MSSQDSFSDLFKLSHIIADGLSTLKNISPNLPNINVPVFDPAQEAFRANPEADKASRQVASAGLQLAMSLLPPNESLYLIISGMFKSAVLRVALENNVTEILRDAGPEGLHAEKIAEKSGVDSGTIARILRALATNHIYREVKPDVFVNNRVSSLLDTGKSVDEIRASPDNKHDNTPGFAALVSHHLDEVFKCAAYLQECINDPSNNRTGRNAKSAVNYAFKDGSIDYWGWYAKEENAHRQKRFGIAMQGVSAFQSPDTVLRAYDWDNLPKGSVVVDVGGGVGTWSFPLAEKHDHLNIVIQDRAPVVEEGEKAWLSLESHLGKFSIQFKTWKTKNPDALASGRVSFQVHDFFTPQPVKEPAVYLLKHILHDWSDVFCLDILKQLRASAGKHTKLIVFDTLLTYACPVDDSDVNIPGAIQNLAPTPLLANGGTAMVGMPQTTDIIVLASLNAKERTILEMQKLLKSGGWQLTRVRRSEGDIGFLFPIEAIPTAELA